MRGAAQGGAFSIVYEVFVVYPNGNRGRVYEYTTAAAAKQRRDLFHQLGFGINGYGTVHCLKVTRTRAT